MERASFRPSLWTVVLLAGMVSCHQGFELCAVDSANLFSGSVVLDIAMRNLQ
jgi:hypothetical protein